MHVCSELECPPVRIITGDCDGEHMQMRWGVCICDLGYISQEGVCEPCPDGQYSDGIKGCLPCPGENVLTCDHNGQALTCLENHVVQGGVCVPCVDAVAPVCPADNECCTLDGPEDACGKPTPVYGFKDSSNKCHLCSDTASYQISGEECLKCALSATPRRIFMHYDSSTQYCGLVDCGENSFHDQYFTCRSCSDTSSYKTTPEECEKCGDLRMMIDNLCVLKKDCDENSFLGQDDQCHPCESDAPYITSETQCDRCGGNRKMIKKYCVLDRKCPENSFLAADGQCYPCSATISYETTDEECAKCGTMRSMTNTNSSTECALNKGCPENEFRGLDLCYPCDMLSGGPYVTIENSTQCDGTESPRFLSTHLSSFSCFTGSIIRSTPEECARCGELRRYDTSLGACIRK